MNSLGARRSVVAGAAVVCALVLASCGGSTKASSATTTTTTNRTNRLAAFRTCMAQQGVDLPANFSLGGFGGRRGGATGTSGSTETTTGTVPTTTGTVPTTTLPPGVTAQQYRTALQACASTLGTAGGGGNGANNPQLTQYRDCLNQYLTSNGGTTLPSTGAGAFGFGGGGGGGGGATTTSNPLMQAAINHCASLRPAFTGRGRTTTTTA
ncbi:MAG: hypothetical protein ACRDZ8_10920 [Acidimicrobiales bacterium]